MKHFKAGFWVVALALLSACEPGVSAPKAPGELALRTAASKALVSYELGELSTLEGIVIKFAEGSGVRERSGALVAVADQVRPQALGSGVDALTADLRGVRTQLDAYGVDARPMFDLPEAQLTRIQMDGQQRSQRALADLNLYFKAPIPAGMTAVELARLLRELNALDTVEIAYAPRRSVPAAFTPPPAATPNYIGNQGYLEPASAGGIDARYAWTKAGGRGENARIVDVEYAWNLTHEDLPEPFLGEGTMYNEYRDHGTAVLGVLGGVANGYGVEGIVPAARLGWSAQYPVGVASAIVNAMQRMSAGDIFLLEAQTEISVDFTSDTRPCTCSGTTCYGPVEYWPAEYDAIAAATANGIIVVEAAGNGMVDLDHPALGGAFNRDQRDSGAIIVGAGSSQRREPLCFTTYGTRVDVHGWGENVMTTGYGDLRDPDAPENANKWYTSGFNGTSSASPIVAGAAAALVSIAKAELNRTLTPVEVRTLLSSTGVEQAYALERPIGSFPNLRDAISLLLDEDTPPLVTIESASPGVRRIHLIGSASDVNSDLQRVEARLDGGNWMVVTGLESWSFNFEQVAPGEHQVEARAVDRAGLVSPIAGPRSVRVPSEVGDCVEVPCVNATEILPIPDNEPRGMTTTIEVNQFNADLEALRLTARVRHPNRGDLRVILQSPTGRQVVVHDRTGGTSDDLDLALTLTSFNNDEVVGLWSLTVIDTRALNVGQLESWSLQLVPGAVCGDGVVTGDEVCDGSVVDCTSLGLEWESGTAACDASCGDYDTSLCVPASDDACAAEPCENATRLAIPDKNDSGVSSQISVPYFASPVSSVRVVVNITHSYRGDLHVKLRSPAGTERVLHNRSGGSARNLNLDLSLQDFNADATIAGLWTLTVSDRAAQDVGTLDFWSLQITPASRAVCGDGVVDMGEVCDGNRVLCSSLGSEWQSGEANCQSDCTGYDTSTCVPRPHNDSCVASPCVNATAIAIPDNNSIGVSSRINVASFASRIASVRVRANITHSYRGDLIVILKSPELSGSTPVRITLHNRAGGSLDNLNLDLNLTAFNQAATLAGDWTLTVSDNASRDVGTLNDWSLQLVPAP